MDKVARYGTLLEHDHDGVHVEDEVDTSDVVNFGRDEGFQIDRIYIYPPFNEAGALENLTVQILVDGASVDVLHLHSSVHPPLMKNSKWLAIPLGKRASSSPIDNTCIKGKSRIQVRCVGGKDGVTGTYKIKVLGDLFDGDDSVKRLLGDTFNPTPDTVYDVQRNKKVTIHKPLASSIRNLTSMNGGGLKAPTPRVLPYITFARNRVPTTPNEPYSFSLHGEFVDKGWEDLEWDLDSNEALMLSHIAVRQVPNSRDLWLEIGDIEMPRAHFDIREFTNELPFSTFDSEQPPRAYPVLIRGENAVIKIRDTGTLIPADSLLIGVWGKKFEL